jgi:hypothetical protein
MPLLTLLQTTSQKLTALFGLRVVRYLSITLLVVLVWGIYDVRCFRNMSAPEAMDAAQLGRSLASGRGFTTDFVRPLSIYLIRQKNTNAASSDPAQLKGGHPDIANAPAYPVVLAGLMNILPFRYEAALPGSFWSTPDPSNPLKPQGTRYQPDFLIAIFNQALFIAIIVLAFFWARRQFDVRVAWTSVILLLGSELLWRFTVSGLSTMMLVLITMCLLWCLTLLEREGREPRLGFASVIGLGVVVGVLTGLGALTRYSFMWMIIPVILFLAFFGGRRRAVPCVLAFVVFVAILAPWMARNHAMCGKFFGIGSYSLVEGWAPGFHLQRSLAPEVPHASPIACLSKLTSNLLPILQSDVLKLGGGWISAFFLAGLLVGFRSPALRRVRYFVVGSLITLMIVQALGRTQLSEETPETNSENLLILFAPAVLLYGVGMFFLLLDSLKTTIPELRHLATVLFVAVLCFPMVLAVASPKKNPVVYPPYRPQTIQSSAHLLKPTETMMSDIPWAVAWYGDRQCVWLTLLVNPPHSTEHEWRESFFAINDGLIPINALYLTPRTIDGRFLSDWLRAGDSSWGEFVIHTVLNKEAPQGFPLSKMRPGYLPEEILLYDWPRW